MFVVDPRQKEKMDYKQMGVMRGIQLIDKISVSNINMNDNYEDNDEHDENEAPKGQALKPKQRRSN